jgi:Putative Flp pilus-assembly TadE/G-like
MKTRIRRHAEDERGATIVMVAAAIGTLILVTAFVVDIANWYVHKRHLQVQADAAALAGGAAFTLPGCNDTSIQKAAQQYSGVPDTGLAIAAPYNAQLGGTASGNVHMLLNADRYWPDGGTNFSDGGMPCAASRVDVKMTESNLPWFLRLPLVVPAINAHARVSMRLVSQLKGQLPIGVPDVNPQSGAVIFYDEADPTSLTTTYVRYLHKIGTAGGLNEWANVDSTGTATPISVTMPASGRVGVVTAFSSDGPPTSSPMSISGSVVDICGRARVDCYNDPATSGLLFVHGFSSAAVPNKIPVIKGATVSTANCPDTYGYFTYNDASCTATLTVNFDTTISNANLGNVQLSLSSGGNCTVGSDSNNPPASKTRTYTVNIPAHAGPCPISVTWIVKSETGFPSPPAPSTGICGNAFNNNNPCHGSFGVVQRVNSGDEDLSGPVRTAHLLNMGSAFGTPSCPGPLGFGPACNSFPIGETHSLAVDVQLAGAVSTSASDPPILLRIVGGSRNGTIDCNKTGNLRDQLANGCDLPYRTNTDTNFACPATTKTGLLATQQPYPCVAVQTGGSVGQFTQGIQARILGGSNNCPASGAGRNYWSNYGTSTGLPSPDNPTYPFNDPRIVYVFMVPFGSFRGSGNAILPIVSFGIFYVRGWGGNGGGNDDPCPDAIPNVPAGDLAGNFITHVADSATAFGTEACVSGGFNPCVAILTK